MAAAEIGYAGEAVAQAAEDAVSKTAEEITSDEILPEGIAHEEIVSEETGTDKVPEVTDGDATAEVTAAAEPEEVIK
jgi:hypothetical protein